MTDNKTLRPIAAGTILTITTGDYSAYTVQGVFRAVSDINTQQLYADYVASRPEDYDDFLDHEIFLGWVWQRGLIEEIATVEWNIDTWCCEPRQGVSAIRRLEECQRAYAETFHADGPTPLSGSDAP